MIRLVPELGFGRLISSGVLRSTRRTKDKYYYPVEMRPSQLAHQALIVSDQRIKELHEIW